MKNILAVLANNTIMMSIKTKATCFVAAILLFLMSCNESGRVNERVTSESNQKAGFGNSLIDHDLGSSGKEMIGDMSVAYLRRAGLTIEPDIAKISAEFTRYFNGEAIQMKAVLFADDKGWGELDSLIFHYNNKEHHISSLHYLMNANTLISLKKESNQNIRFEDYNFDKYPDLVVYNSGSGTKNIVEDKYLYDPVDSLFKLHEGLSFPPNISFDTLTQTISTFVAGGHASRIYGADKYKWVGHNLTLIETRQQDYNESLNRYILEIKTLKDSVWEVKYDTLIYNEEGG